MCKIFSTAAGIECDYREDIMSEFLQMLDSGN